MALPFNLGYDMGPVPTPPQLGPFQGMPGSWSAFPRPAIPLGPGPLPPYVQYSNPIGPSIPPYQQYASSIGPEVPGAVPNLAQRLMSPFLRTAENPGAWAEAEGLGAKAALGLRGLGWGLAGQAVGTGVQKLLPGSGTAEHVLSGAAKGAGIGAGIGAIGLPIPILGELTTGGGALLGGAIGGLAGLLHGSPKKGPATINLANLYQQANIDPGTAAQYDRYYKVLTSIDGSKDGRTKARQTIANLVLQQVAQQQTNPIHSLSPTEIAAMQAQTAKFLQPYTDETLSTARMAAQNTLANLSKVPEAYRGVLSTGAMNQLAASTRLANAYAAQAQLAPQAAALQQQQSQQMSLAAQIQQQALAAQLSGQSGGNSGVNFATLGQNQ